eukprot:scaffold95402_cov38-Prasinocladus_malaysianus.AAC.1
MAKDKHDGRPPQCQEQNYTLCASRRMAMASKRQTVLKRNRQELISDVNALKTALQIATQRSMLDDATLLSG